MSDQLFRRMRGLRLSILFFLLILKGFSLQGQQLALGIRLSATAGQGSGKGFWDWTESSDQGKLLFLPGGGAALVGQYSLPSGMILESSMGIFYTQAGQSLNDENIVYEQFSLELPIYLKKDLPLGQRRFHIGIGPSLSWLPFSAYREAGGIRDSSLSENQWLLGFCVGVDYNWNPQADNPAYLSFRFNHPFLAPKYNWLDQGSGNFRFNHLDFSISYLWLLGENE